MQGNPKNNFYFKGFPDGLFRFLGALSENNSKDWFSEHRSVYISEVLIPIKSLVADLGPIIGLLNQELETDPRVGKTISRIHNDIRFDKNRPPYRPFIYVGFGRRGAKWASEAWLYVRLSAHGISVGFYPGVYRGPRTGPVQEGIRNNLRLFQRYLEERRIPDRYFELTGPEDLPATKWPLPKPARRWVDLDSLNVGDFFVFSDPILARRAFLDRAREILVDLYPLWLFARSEELKKDLELYRESLGSLERPVLRGRKLARP